MAGGPEATDRIPMKTRSGEEVKGFKCRSPGWKPACWVLARFNWCLCWPGDTTSCLSEALGKPGGRLQQSQMPKLPGRLGKPECCSVSSCRAASPSLLVVATCRASSKAKDSVLGLGSGPQEAQSLGMTVTPRTG